MPDQTDGLRLDQSLQALEQRGFRKQFEPRPDAQVLCCSCQRLHPARGLRVEARARIEGVSDPAEESLVLGIRCPSCQAAGTLVLAFGPRAQRTDAEILAALGHLPPAA